MHPSTFYPSFFIEFKGKYLCLRALFLDATEKPPLSTSTFKIIQQQWRHELHASNLHNPNGELEN